MPRNREWLAIRAIAIGIPAALIIIGTIESIVATIFGA